MLSFCKNESKGDLVEQRLEHCGIPFIEQFFNERFVLCKHFAALWGGISQA
jgi:hypothetical protein